MHPLGVAMPKGIGRQLFALMLDFSANRVPYLAAAQIDVQRQYSTSTQSSLIFAVLTTFRLEKSKAVD